MSGINFVIYFRNMFSMCETIFLPSLVFVPSICPVFVVVLGLSDPLPGWSSLLMGWSNRPFSPQIVVSSFKNVFSPFKAAFLPSLEVLSDECNNVDISSIPPGWVLGWSDYPFPPQILVSFYFFVIRIHSSTFL